MTKERESITPGAKCREKIPKAGSEETGEASGPNNGSPYPTEEEEEAVLARLRPIGYID